MRLVNRSRKLVELYEAETKPPTKLLKEKHATDEEEEQQQRTSCVSDLGQGTPRRQCTAGRAAQSEKGTAACQCSGCWSPASSRVGRPREVPAQYGLTTCVRVPGAGRIKRHLEKPPCNSTWWREVKKYSQRSCLVSWREVASPPPPLGCDRQLRRL